MDAENPSHYLLLTIHMGYARSTSPHHQIFQHKEEDLMRFGQKMAPSLDTTKRYLLNEDHPSPCSIFSRLIFPETSSAGTPKSPRMRETMAIAPSNSGCTTIVTPNDFRWRTSAS